MSAALARRNLPLILAAALGLGHCAAFAGEAPQETATAGWAEVEITPPLGIALGGRGGAETPADKVRDPLYAQVLCLRDVKGHRFVLASFDVIGLPHQLSDRIRTRLVHELGADWNLVVLNASHTHSGPYMLRDLMAGVGPAPPVEVDYFQALEEKVANAARAAGKAMQPVKVRVVQGSTDIGINRRGQSQRGRVGMAPDPKGPLDDKLWILQLTPVKGGPSAIVFSCACHAVMVYGSAYTSISADFPGATRKFLREALGPQTHAQFVQGFAGNLRPRILANLDEGRFRTAKPGDLDRAGRELSAAVLAALKTSGGEIKPNIAGACDRPFLPRDNPPPRQNYERMRANALASTNAYRLAVADYWLKRYDAGEGFARGDAWSLGLIRLAEDQWIVHCGGEPCIEWRAKMAAWLAPRKIATWGYCEEANTYLPTEALLGEGGYEVLESNQNRASSPAQFAPGIERAVRESLLRQLAFIQAGAE
jgi:neutral ceramidase